MSVLEVRNLKKSFDKDTVVLKGVDFSLEKGETVAIIGSSGSGKTTLLRCLNFLTVPDEGQIGAWALESVRRFQSLNIVEGNEHGFFLPKRNASRAEAAAIYARLIITIFEAYGA